jgi:hypothetical protein
MNRRVPRGGEVFEKIRPGWQNFYLRAAKFPPGKIRSP